MELQCKAKHETRCRQVLEDEKREIASTGPSIHAARPDSGHATLQACTLSRPELTWNGLFRGMVAWGTSSLQEKLKPRRRCKGQDRDP